jgi:glycine/D-amino acid oxidase-like deaminating enzyme
MMNSQEKTIIIGAGIAGISCALKLRRAGRPFVMVTESLGGRICYSDEEKVNFGAYFTVSDYHNVKKILKKESPLKKTSCLYHNSENECYTLFRWKTLLQLLQFIRFAVSMIKFKRHYERYKKRCEVMPVREALSSDPYMQEVFYRPALDFIEEKRFREVHDDYFSKLTFACTAVTTDNLNTLDYLNLCIALVLPIHRFVFDNKGMADMFRDELVIDSVTEIKKTADGYTVKTKSGRVFAEKYVVVATPGYITKQLLNLPFIRNSYFISTSHVSGRLKEKYRKYFMHLFAEGAPILTISLQDDNSYLVHASTPSEEKYLNDYFEEYTMHGKVSWEKSLYAEGKEIVDEQVEEFGDNLYIAGEHNGVGMEPSAISGMYAANAILKFTH